VRGVLLKGSVLALGALLAAPAVAGTNPLPRVERSWSWASRSDQQRACRVTVRELERNLGVRLLAELRSPPLPREKPACQHTRAPSAALPRAEGSFVLGREDPGVGELRAKPHSEG